MFFLGNPSLNIFAISDKYCPIYYSDIFIPTYIENCNHSFCLCYILRWLNSNNTCPIYGKKISRIGYIASKEKNGTIFINTSDLKIDENIINPGKIIDSLFCVLCKKTEPVNQLLLSKP